MLIIWAPRNKYETQVFSSPTVHGIFGRKITKYTVKYIVYIRFWPTLVMSRGCTRLLAVTLYLDVCVCVGCSLAYKCVCVSLYITASRACAHLSCACVQVCHAAAVGWHVQEPCLRRVGHGGRHRCRLLAQVHSGADAGSDGCRWVALTHVGCIDMRSHWSLCWEGWMQVNCIKTRGLH